MFVHLVDGTYELFRYHYAPANRDPRFAAQRGVLGTLLSLVAEGASHIGIATDHVIESFRNNLFPGYKDGSDIDPNLLAQFPEMETLLELAGFTVWPQVTYEADDGLAAGAAMAAADPRVQQVIICTPDKDLAQCVSADGRIVQHDRRRNITYDWHGVVNKFGVPPELIADYLAMVGDSADGFAGLPGWGAKSAAKILYHFGPIEQVPLDEAKWDVNVRGAAKLAASLRQNIDAAKLYKQLATVNLNAPVTETVDELLWKGPQAGFDQHCYTIGAQPIAERAHQLFAQF